MHFDLLQQHWVSRAQMLASDALVFTYQRVCFIIKLLKVLMIINAIAVKKMILQFTTLTNSKSSPSLISLTTDMCSAVFSPLPGDYLICHTCVLPCVWINALHTSSCLIYSLLFVTLCAACVCVLWLSVFDFCFCFFHQTMNKLKSLL